MNRDVYIESCHIRSVYVWKETYICMNRDVYMYEKRRIYVWKETYDWRDVTWGLHICEKRCIYMFNETYKNEKRRIYVWTETYDSRDVTSIRLFSYIYTRPTSLFIHIYVYTSLFIHLYETYDSRDVTSGLCICEKRPEYICNETYTWKGVSLDL